MNRYRQLAIAVAILEPKRVIEVGTWDGERALSLCIDGAEYYGFDSFETSPGGADDDGMPARAHPSSDQVSERLARSKISHRLIVGDTRDSLPAFLEEVGPDFADLAYISGGHGVDTIAADWDYCRRLVRKGGVVIFDDYCLPDPRKPENHIDTTKFGCNSLVESIGATLLPFGDILPDGSAIHSAAIRI